MSGSSCSPPNPQLAHSRAPQPPAVNGSTLQAAGAVAAPGTGGWEALNPARWMRLLRPTFCLCTATMAEMGHASPRACCLKGSPGGCSGLRSLSVPAKGPASCSQTPLAPMHSPPPVHVPGVRGCAGPAPQSPGQPRGPNLGPSGKMRQVSGVAPQHAPAHLAPVVQPCPPARAP